MLLDSATDSDIGSHAHHAHNATEYAADERDKTVLNGTPSHQHVPCTRLLTLITQFIDPAYDLSNFQWEIFLDTTPATFCFSSAGTLAQCYYIHAVSCAPKEPIVK